jgi:2-phospho-L-lactate guanylyltransferase
MPPPLAVLPLKPFSGAMRRLEPVLDPVQRADLSRAAARRVAGICSAAGFDVVVVAAPQGPVVEWAATLDLDVVPEPPGGGLDGAARAGAAAARSRGRAWCVVHGDLPLLTVPDLELVLQALTPGTAVLAPSRDGGTNLLAAHDPIVFRYGPGSFGRHLAAAAHMERWVIVTTGTVVELDTPEDLRAAARLRGGAWLQPYLS